MGETSSGSVLWDIVLLIFMILLIIGIGIRFFGFWREIFRKIKDLFTRDK